MDGPGHAGWTEGPRKEEGGSQGFPWPSVPGQVVMGEGRPTSQKDGQTRPGEYLGLEEHAVKRKERKASSCRA